MAMESFINAVRMPGIFFYNFPCRCQYGDIAHLMCLLTGLAYPQRTVIVLYQMLLCQLQDINECQAGETAEDKYITDLLQPLNGECLVNQHLQFFP